MAAGVTKHFGVERWQTCLLMVRGGHFVPELTARHVSQRGRGLFRPLFTALLGGSLLCRLLLEDIFRELALGMFPGQQGDP